MLCVSPSHFAEHLDVLANVVDAVIPLDQVLLYQQSDRRLAAITFDDGYADNVLEAKPRLERAGIPATVFVAGDSRNEAPEEFWWDLLDRVLLRPGSLPERFALTIGTSERTFELGANAVYTIQDYQRLRNWRVWEPTPSGRHAVYALLAAELRSRSGESARNIVNDLVNRIAGPDLTPIVHRRMTVSEIITLAEGGLISVAGHTVTHPELPRLPSHEQLRELRDNKAFLESVTGKAVNAFAYPFGSTSSESRRLAGEAGFLAAFTTVRKPLDAADDRFALPRFHVGDMNGEALAALLSNGFASAYV